MSRKKTGLQLKYFVLKPAGTDIHALASRQAMIAYAEMVKHADRDLYNDLVKWAGLEAKKALAERGMKIRFTKTNKKKPKENQR